MTPEMFLLTVIAIVIYFLPSFVAMVRENTQTLAIFILNLTLGWTGLGWIGSLIWAFVKQKN
jgi:hypothetical protein